MILVGRIISLQALHNSSLAKKSLARTSKTLYTPAYRGVIRDRHGVPLAISVPVTSIWINPRKIVKNNPNIITMLKILKLDKNKFEKKLQRHQHKYFLYIKRQVLPEVAQKIQILDIDGVNFRTEYRRYYPGGAVNAHLLGFTGIDHNGQEGVELRFNDWLQGTNGTQQVIKDARGKVVNILTKNNNHVAGRDLILSVDQKLQYKAYTALEAAVKKHQAKAGSVVVLDVTTGEVLAMVNQPSFNPNNRDAIDNSTRLRNRAATYTFEAGSVIKTFSMASALESGTTNLNTKVHTSPGVFKVHGGVISDLRDYGLIDLHTILKKSSNIGISKLVLKNDPGVLFDFYTRLGFGEVTGSEFPGERRGSVVDPRNYQGNFVLATMAFGYGLAVTPLQLARAYAALGADGILRSVSLLKTDTAVSEQVAFPSEVAKNVRDLITDNNARAGVRGYRIVGKTGSARKLGKHGYDDKRHISVFAGVVPANKPKFAIVVILDDPQIGGFYGNIVAAPVFSKIADAALRLSATPLELIRAKGI